MSDPELPAPSDNGKLLAVLSYASFFVGLPLGVIPLLTRDDAYALRHGRTSTAIFLVLFGVSMVLSVVLVPLIACTYGLALLIAFPLVMLLALWPAIVAIHGLILVVNGSWDDPILTFGLGEKIFGGITLKEEVEILD